MVRFFGSSQSILGGVPEARQWSRFAGWTEGQDPSQVAPVASYTGDTAIKGAIWGRVTSPATYWDWPGQPTDVLGFAGLTVYWRTGSGLRVGLFNESGASPNGVVAGTQFSTANATVNAATSLQLAFFTYDGAGAGSGIFAVPSVLVYVRVNGSSTQMYRWVVTSSACTADPSLPETWTVTIPGWQAAH